MNNQKLLYVSPFLPQKSGISDYSEVLIYALKEYFEITILIDDYRLSNKQIYHDFNVIVYQKQDIDFDKFDYVIYNIGNNPYYHSYIYKLCLQHPGLVILHDCILYYLVVGYYEKFNCVYSKIYEIGGAEAIGIIKRALQNEIKPLLELKEIASILPLNKELAESGNKIMVHSEYAKNMIIKYVSDPSKVKKINLIKQTKKDTKIIDRHILFKKFGIPEDVLVITSFGYIAETKLNNLVCEAVNSLVLKNNKLCYVMVGEGEFVDHYVDNKKIFKTGYVTLDEFNSFLKYTDIVANLRFPSMGETSAAMVRIMEYGKPCIIINDGWFAEIPKDCVVSIDKNNISNFEEYLEMLLFNKPLRNELGKRAQMYVTEMHSPERVCKEICAFLHEEEC